METLAQLPVAAGLFQGEGVDTRLIGSRCAGCGTHYFPKSLSCRNPQCRTKQVEDVLLGPQGTLYSYTVQSYRPPPLFRMEPWAPYALGMVELPEGLRVLGMLTGIPLDALRIGMPVVLTTEALYRNDDGQEVLTYKFAPAAPEGDAA